MNREELKKLITGPVATVPTPFDDEFQVDFGRMAELTRWWVANGLGTATAPIKVAAAGGEGPDLSDDEWPHLLRTAVDAAGKDAVIICGLKTKNTLHTIDDARKAADLGAIGVQIDLPVFHHSNQDDYVRFYTDISDHIDIGIVIYNTFWFGVETITPATLLRLADAEHVVAVKWNVPSFRDKAAFGPQYDDMTQFAHIFNVIDNSGQPVRCHKNGGRGYISDAVAAYPQHDLGIWALMEAGRYEEADAQFVRAREATASLRARVRARSGGYRFLKGLMTAMGQHAGPPRPPTLPMDAAEVAELRDALVGLGWPVGK